MVPLDSWDFMLENSNSKNAQEGKEDGVLKISLVVLMILILLFNAQRISTLISFLSLSSYYMVVTEKYFCKSL